MTGSPGTLGRAVHVVANRRLDIKQMLHRLSGRGRRLPQGLLCGIAVNQREMLDCFDLVFLLTLDDTTQLARLDTASNAHRTGRLAIVQS